VIYKINYGKSRRRYKGGDYGTTVRIGEHIVLREFAPFETPMDYDYKP
jgi:hypothetical protein